MLTRGSSLFSGIQVMSNFSKSAEKYFALKCNEGGATATVPDEDKNGWDFLVEFPLSEFSGSKEDRPSPRTAYVQIKSTVGNSMKTKIKVSNMLIASQSPDPWFVIFVTPDDEGKNKAIRAIHIDRDLISRSLKATRKHSLIGSDLHKRYITITFSENSIVDRDIVVWMQEKIGPSALEYSQSKKKFADEVGYEQGHGVVKISFNTGNNFEFERAFLGLKSDLEVSALEYTPERFGIPDKNPKANFSSDGSQFGKLSVEPKSVAICEIKASGPESETPISLGGQIFIFKYPSEGGDDICVRFSAPPIEIVKGSNDKWTFELEHSNTERHSLSRLYTMAKLRKWLLEGKVSYEVWSNEKLSFQGTTTNHGQKQNYQKDNFCQAINALQLATTQGTLVSPSVSVDELNAALPHLGYYYQFLGEESLRVSIEQEKRYPYQFDSVIYYVTTTVGAWTFCCLARRQVTGDTIIEGDRHITCGAPEILDRCVVENSEETAIIRIAADFERASKSRGEREEVFTMGNIASFMREPSTLD